MTKPAYPDYIEILKLRKAHPIYQIAALILGIDPRTLKLMPDYHPGKSLYEYPPESKTFMYVPVKASKTPLDEYLQSESANHTLVPLLNLPDDLGEYAPSITDVLFQEFKTALLSAVKDKEIECVVPGSIPEESYLKAASENTLVKTNSVRDWLIRNNFRTPYFDKPATYEGLSSLFDKNHTDHSPELAIAVEAWIRFSGMGISHPKKYIENWLEQKYPALNEETADAVKILVSAKAKNRITTLVNWNSEGGVNSQAYSATLFEQGATKKLCHSEG